MIINHATLEEKQQYKYYCKYCDIVLFCKLYHEKHINSKKHKNNILADKLNNI